MKLLTIAILAMLPVLSAFAGPQSKQPQRDRGNDQQQDARGQARDSSLSDAVRRVERDTRGEVLSAERVQYDGRDMHRVKVVDDEGRVRVFMQDPNRRDDGASDSNRDGGNDDNRNSRRDSRRDSQRPRPTRSDDN